MSYPILALAILSLGGFIQSASYRSIGNSKEASSWLTAAYLNAFLVGLLGLLA